MIDIVITSNTRPQHHHMLMNCINTCRISEAFCGKKMNIIVIESYAEKASGQDKTVLYLEDPYNCHRAVKSVLPHLTQEWVGIFNNDVLFYPDWFTEILKAHEARPDISSFSTWSQLWDWHPNIFPDPEPIIEGYDVGRIFCGWAFIIKTELLKTIRMDERCDFWYSDNIMADEMRERGLIHALIPAARIDHIVSQTNRLTHEQTTKDRSAYYAGLTGIKK